MPLTPLAMKIEFSHLYSISINVLRHVIVIGYHLIWGCTVIPRNDYSELNFLKVQQSSETA